MGVVAKLVSYAPIYGGDDHGQYECQECGLELDERYHQCPRCGCYRVERTEWEIK